MIPVTKPYLPALDKYAELVSGIFEREWLTNNGPLLNEFENKLKSYLNIDQLCVVSNGTIAIQLGIKALGLKGEIITTPFSYVATTSSIVWEGCTPVYVDIDKDTLNIDPVKIEAAVSPHTTAILATHCFGNPCDIEAIDEIAKKYNLKVIYDAAHCFGTTYKGKSVFEYGDISTTSFHATKLMHSAEGGAVFTKDMKTLERVNYMRNFGHDGPGKFNGAGINGKNSELHAAMGLCVLDSIEAILDKRKSQCNYYDSLLEGLPLRKQFIEQGAEFNYAYFPVIFEREKEVLLAKKNLEANEIFPRRYFYPSLSNLDYVSAQTTPVSNYIASSILCLPLYHDLSEQDQEKVADILKNK